MKGGVEECVCKDTIANNDARGRRGVGQHTMAGREGVAGGDERGEGAKRRRERERGCRVAVHGTTTNDGEEDEEAKAKECKRQRVGRRTARVDSKNNKDKTHTSSQ